MAALISIWEVHHFTQEKWVDELWQLGITSLQSMLPYYSTGWWSLYDLDTQSPFANVNSPRYHLLEIHYLQVLSLLSQSSLIEQEYKNRMRQYQHVLSKVRALSLKCARKMLYR